MIFDKISLKISVLIIFDFIGPKTFLGEHFNVVVYTSSGKTVIEIMRAFLVKVWVTMSKKGVRRIKNLAGRNIC